MCFWEVGDTMNFRSITAYRDYQVARGQDIDFTGADILYPQDSDETFENFSQEFQFYGESGDLSWLVGGYVLHRGSGIHGIHRAEQRRRQVHRVPVRQSGRRTRIHGRPGGPWAFPARATMRSFSSETVGWSLFTHNTWHVSDAFDVTAGARYSWEEKDAGMIINGAPFGEVINDPFCNVFGFIPAFFSLCDNQSYNNKEDESKLTGTLKGTWKVNDDISVYAGYSRGYKAGGYNLDQEAVGFRDADGNFVDQSRFDPETSDSFENRASRRDCSTQRLTINTALFHTTFDDFQLNTFTGLGFTVGNVRKSGLLGRGGGILHGPGRRRFPDRRRHLHRCALRRRPDTG